MKQSYQKSYWPLGPKQTGEGGIAFFPAFQVPSGVQPEYERDAWSPFDALQLLNEGWIATAKRAEAIEMLERQLRAVFGHAEKFYELCQRVERVEAMLEEGFRRLEQIGVPRKSIWVPIESFTPEPYEIVQPFTAVVVPIDDAFEAGFFDANIFATGDTEEEAVANLKSVLLDTYDRLDYLQEDQLGPAPARQKQVLNLFIRRKQI
jgi:hypothetical protein